MTKIGSRREHFAALAGTMLACCRPPSLALHYWVEDFAFMFRRGMSILVLLGFFANQLAMIPHTHGGDWPEHESQPHIHLAAAGHSHSHDHDHQHGHRHHGDLDTAAEQPQDAMEPLGEHDANALYFSGLKVFTDSSSWLKGVQQTDSQQPLVTAAKFLDQIADSFWQPPPDDPHQSCPTFLRLRNLRI